VRFVDDELDQSAPELAEDLERRVDYPEHTTESVVWAGLASAANAVL
jgi:hypothetical protein